MATDEGAKMETMEMSVLEGAEATPGKMSWDVHGVPWEDYPYAEFIRRRLPDYPIWTPDAQWKMVTAYSPNQDAYKLIPDHAFDYIRAYEAVDTRLPLGLYNDLCRSDVQSLLRFTYACAQTIFANKGRAADTDPPSTRVRIAMAVIANCDADQLVVPDEECDSDDDMSGAGSVGDRKRKPVIQEADAVSRACIISFTPGWEAKIGTLDPVPRLMDVWHQGITQPRSLLPHSLVRSVLVGVRLFFPE